MSLGSLDGAMSEAVGQARLREYWDWLAAALFLLLAVDTLTTLAAARVVGAGAEANPLMSWALGRGLWAVVGLNLVALVAIATLFGRLTERIEGTPAPADRYVAFLVEVWLGVMVAIGLAVFANNVSVIVLRRSLL